MTKLYIALLVLLTILVLCFILILPASAQSPIDDALATLQAATRQSQQDQWNRQAQATRQAQSLQATTQASAIEAEATRQAIIVNASATAQAQGIQIEATRQAHLGNIAATATYQAVQIQYQSTQEAVALDATRQAYYIKLDEMQERSAVGTLLLYFAGGLAALGLFAMFLIMLNRALGTEKLKPIQIIDTTYTTKTPLLLAAPNTLVMTELPDVFEDVIEDLIDGD